MTKIFKKSVYRARIYFGSGCRRPQPVVAAPLTKQRLNIMAESMGWGEWILPVIISTGGSLVIERKTGLEIWTLVLKLTPQGQLSSSQPLVYSTLTTLKMRSSLTSIQELTYPQEGHTVAHCSWRSVYPISSIASRILLPVLHSPPRGNGFHSFVTNCVLSSERI